MAVDTQTTAPAPIPASSSTKPLTAAERAQLADLSARAAQDDRNAKEADRKAQLAAMPNLVAFADALIAANLDEKVAAILASSETMGDADTVVRLDRIRTYLAFDFKLVLDKVQALRAPIDPLPIDAPQVKLPAA